VAKIENIAKVALSEVVWVPLAATSAAHMTEHLFNGVIVVVLPIIPTTFGLSLAETGALASARTLFACNSLD
jgi:hypothetical protein